MGATVFVTSSPGAGEGPGVTSVAVSPSSVPSGARPEAAAVLVRLPRSTSACVTVTVKAQGAEVSPGASRATVQASVGAIGSVTDRSVSVTVPVLLMASR